MSGTSRSRTLRLSYIAVVGTVVASALTVSSAPATAGSVTRDYSCDVPNLGAHDSSLELKAPPLPAKVPTAVTVPAGTTPVTAVLTLPATLTTLLVPSGGLQGETTDFAPGLGAQELPASLVAPVNTLTPGETADLVFTGSADELLVPAPGRYPISLPPTFAFVMYTSSGASLGEVVCTLVGGDAGRVGTLHVVKQTSSLAARALNEPVQAGSRAQVLVVVKDQLGDGAAGKVNAMSHGNKVGKGILRHGTAKLRLKRLGSGTHKVRLVYLGNQTTKQGAGLLKVTVGPHR